MSINLAALEKIFGEKILTPKSSEKGETIYRLPPVNLPPNRLIDWAELRLPRGFPHYDRAQVYLPQNCALRIPHVEDNGKLCVPGDPGPSLGYSQEERIALLISDYHDLILKPWSTGQLDDDFAQEPLTYWYVYASQHLDKSNPVKTLYTMDKRPSKASVREGWLLSSGVAIADHDLPMTNRLLQQSKGSTRKVLIADIPLFEELTPATWPKDIEDIEATVAKHLSNKQTDTFLESPVNRRHSHHRILLLRFQSYSIAYLLPGGPHTPKPHLSNKTALAKDSLLPLVVRRLDPDWTVARDQCPTVTKRQGTTLLVAGAGALGSPVVEHLAKAGVGKIKLIDPDTLEPENTGRHLLGIDDVQKNKAKAIARKVVAAHPSVIIEAYDSRIEQWLQTHSLSEVDIILDLTGEPIVRQVIDQARRKTPRPLLVGWFEPYVAGAHACILDKNTFWMDLSPLNGVSGRDIIASFDAIEWPDQVYQQNPGCTSTFQSYTDAAATYAVGMVTEQILSMIDKPPIQTHVTSWVRGQNYLDAQWEGLKLKDWASAAADFDGMILERQLEESVLSHD